jgi:hypothetical protein
VSSPQNGPPAIPTLLAPRAAAAAAQATYLSIVRFMTFPPLDIP